MAGPDPQTQLFIKALRSFKSQYPSVNEEIKLISTDDLLPNHAEIDMLYLANGRRIMAQFSGDDTLWKTCKVYYKQESIPPILVKGYVKLVDSIDSQPYWLIDERIGSTKKHNSMRNMIQIYQDKNGTAITTDATDEREFIEGMASLLYESIVTASPQEDWHSRLGLLLPQIVDIACKYRGYKSSVTEKKVLTTGQVLSGEPIAQLGSPERVATRVALEG